MKAEEFSPPEDHDVEVGCLICLLDLRFYVCWQGRFTA
jgi:hypothetical protein